MTLNHVYKVHKLASLVEVVEGSEWVEYLTKKNILFFLSLHYYYYYYFDKSRKELERGRHSQFEAGQGQPSMTMKKLNKLGQLIPLSYIF